jgi:hypothetical protein
MAFASQFVVEVFTKDAAYSAFGAVYPIERMPALLAAALRGQFIGNTPVADIDGERATGIQQLVCIDQQTHAMHLACYRDEYVQHARRLAHPPARHVPAQARRLRLRAAARPTRRARQGHPRRLTRAAARPRSDW